MAQTTRVKERQAAQAQRIKQAQAFLVPDHIDVAILGGGAAGLCAAITAAEALEANKRIVVFEKALEVPSYQTSKFHSITLTQTSSKSWCAVCFGTRSNINQAT